MGSLYWRQFMLGAGMVLLTMVLLGVSFYALSYNYTVSEKRSEMRDRANLIAQLSVSYLLPSDEAAATQEDALRALAGVASRMTDVDFLICNRDGDVLLTSDAGLVGKSVRVPEEIVTRTFAEDDGYEGRSTVGVYEQKKFVVGVPMTGEDGAVLGLVYKNHPLRRVDNLIYYGSMADKYIVMFQILDTKKEQDLNVATRVSVQLQLTDPDLRSRDRVVKKSEKDSLYAAMDVGTIWLERALAGKL